MVVVAAALLIAGNALAFALEGLVAAVQAIRLEYYELFSRVFVAEGRAFRPWRLRIDSGEAGRRENGSGPVMARAAGAIGLRWGSRPGTDVRPDTCSPPRAYSSWPLL
jgi:hypothetical protein